MKYTKVIFIDPGTSFGWASCTEGCYDSGAIPLPKNPGLRVLDFWVRLGIIVNMWYKEKVFVAWEEAAWGGHSKADRMYGTWEGLLLLFCEMHSIPYMAVNGSTLKAFARKNGFYTSRPPKPRKLKTDNVRMYNSKMSAWENDNIEYDKKPRPRPGWIISSAGKLQEHEIDARWGLEYILKELANKEN